MSRPSITHEDLAKLEHAARIATTDSAGAWRGVLIRGDVALELVETRKRLEALRATKQCDNVIANLRYDREEWLHNERTGQEDYPGEARELRESHDLALALLDGPRLAVRPEALPSFDLPPAELPGGAHTLSDCMPQPREFEPRSDWVRAVNAWCFERGLYVMSVCIAPLLGRGECTVMRPDGEELSARDSTIAGLIERLNRWHRGVS